MKTPYTDREIVMTSYLLDRHSQKGFTVTDIFLRKIDQIGDVLLTDG